MKKIEILNIETEEQILKRFDKMVHICHSDDFEDRSYEKALSLYNRIIDKEHLSQVEHIVFYFIASGISRSCMSQITRHRLASYSVQSITHTKNIGFVLPKRIENNKLILDALDQIKDIYENLLENGVSKADARFTLPISTGIKYSMTTNLRSLINFFRLRKNEYKKAEIREIGFLLLDELYKCYPTIIGKIKDKYKL